MTKGGPIDAKRLAGCLLLEYELGGAEAQLFPLLFSCHPFYTVLVTDCTPLRHGSLDGSEERLKFVRTIVAYPIDEESWCAVHSTTYTT